MWITKYEVRDKFKLNIEGELVEFEKGSFVFTSYLPMSFGKSYETIYVEENRKLKKLGICETGCDIINNCNNLGLRQH